MSRATVVVDNNPTLTEKLLGARQTAVNLFAAVESTGTVTSSFTDMLEQKQLHFHPDFVDNYRQEM